MRLGLNIRVVAVTQQLPGKARIALRALIHLVVIAFLAVFTWSSIDVIELNAGGTMLSTGWSNTVFSVPLFVGGLILLVYQTRLLILAVLGLFGRIELIEDDTAGTGAGLG